MKIYDLDLPYVVEKFEDTVMINASIGQKFSTICCMNSYHPWQKSFWDESAFQFM